MKLPVWLRRRPTEIHVSTSADDPAPPGADPVWEAQVRAEVEAFRPYIRADGGDVEFVGIRDGVAHVRLKGACVGCPASFMTLQMGIEARLRARFPQIREVRNEG